MKPYTYGRQVPVELGKFRVRPGDGAGAVRMLQGLLAMVRLGCEEALAFLRDGGVKRPGVGTDAGLQLRALAGRIGQRTGLCDLGFPPPGGLEHDADDARLPAWSASNPQGWDEVMQWLWPVVAGLSFIATNETALEALAALPPGETRAAGVAALAELFAEGLRAPT